MTVGQIIDLAKNSELNGLSVSSKNEVLISYLNLGVLELYKRFQLKVEEHIIELQNTIDIYTMPNDYMWIVAAYGEVPVDSVDSVNILPINEEDNPLSINTVGWNKVQVPVTVDGAYVSIIYVASPDVYTVNDLNVEVALPAQMIETLLAYIGYRANSAIDTGVQTEDSVYYQRFEASCDKLKQFGMFNSDDMFMSKRLTLRGFV